MNSEYREALRSFPVVGKTHYREIELRDPASAPFHKGPFGLVLDDAHLRVFRDLVLHPSGASDSYLRLIQGAPGQEICGAVFLGLRLYFDREPDLLWVRSWRHSVQGWCTELPRGGVGSHEQGSLGVLREVREETSVGDPEVLVCLGDTNPDSGLLATRVRFYAGLYSRDMKVSPRASSDREAISEAFWAPLSQWKQIASVPGYPGRPIGALDGFTASAVGLAYASQLFQRAADSFMTLRPTPIHSELLSSAVQQALGDGVDEMDVSVRFRSREDAARVLAELPMLAAHALVHENLARIPSVAPLSIAWLTHDPGVRRISLKGE